MASAIDETKPVAGSPTTESVRGNFSAAKTEIEGLQTGADIAAATKTSQGVVELATSTETNTGTDETRAVTPDGLNDWTGSVNIATVGTVTSGTWQGEDIDPIYLPEASTTVKGMIEIATSSQVNTGSGTNLAVTSSNLGNWTGNTSITSVGTIGAGIWEGDEIGTSYLPSASNSAEGVVELATQTETDDGTGGSRVISSTKLTAWTGSTNIVTLGVVEDFESTGIDDNASATAVTIASDGDVGFGVATPAARVDAKGSGTTSATSAFYARNSSSVGILQARDDGFVRMQSTYSNTTGSAANVNMDESGFLRRSTSGRKYKRDITPYEKGMEVADLLRPVTFKSVGGDETVYAGFIAEDLHDAGLTEFVVYDADGKPDAIHYAHMTALAFNCIQQLSARLAELEA